MTYCYSSPIINKKKKLNSRPCLSFTGITQFKVDIEPAFNPRNH